MDTDLAQLEQADTAHAIEIAPRVWWVGHLSRDGGIGTHVYLVEQGEQSVLLDPGSRCGFADTLRRIEEVIPFASIRYFVCHHPGPDVAAAMPVIDEMASRPDALLVTHGHTHALLSHYGLKLSQRRVEDHDWRLPLEDREFQFILTPYAPSSGSIASFDPGSGLLFSGALFGALTEGATLIARDESFSEALQIFHAQQMPSRDILDLALSRCERHPIKAIAPHQGPLIPERLVPSAIEALRHLGCGIDLLSGAPTDTRRLSRLNERLREITQTLLDHGATESARQDAYQRSIRDPLTGLFTRPYMQDVMERHCSVHDRNQAAQVAAVMIDVDYLQWVNDTHGRAAGDAVLRQVAQILRDRIRNTDIPVRFGGAGLILFLVGASAFGAMDYAERIRAAVEHHPFETPAGHQLSVTASLGVAIRHPHEPLEELIRRADQALCQAKQGGRNRVELA
ncbi:MAG: diguanylate cyclase [Thiocapsa sp.]|nr:diguanylate cyclase [Thiocapsa sp.]MCG6896785.1 diguanylate cyclase [Thiocapsa sp.]